FKKGTAKALKDLTDAGKRAQAEALLKTLGASFEKGELDLFGQMSPNGKQFNVVAGVKVQDGDKLAKMVRDLVEDLLKNARKEERTKVKLDADSVGPIKIHRVDIQKTFDAQARELFGDNPLYVAFKKDAVMIAMGAGGLEVLKQALAATPAASPPMQLE